MKTILVCNQKGGVGKSLCADEIAFSFERSGIPVSFYDLDTQGGTLHETHEADGAQGRRGGHAGGLAGGAGGLAEGGGRGGHPDQDHVEGHRTADAHAQGGVQEWPREDCLRDERVEPLQGVPRLHGVVRGSGCDQTVATLPQSEAFVQAGAAGQVRGRVRPTRQGREGDSRSGGHGAARPRVPEGISN